MPVSVDTLTEKDAQAICQREESHFWDFKSARIKPSKLQKTVVALLNADGGEVLVGVEDPKAGTSLASRWKGFETQEKANGHIQSLTLMVPTPPIEFRFLTVENKPQLGYALLVKAHKSENVHKTSAAECYLRKSSQDLPLKSEEVIQNLRLSKGLISFEDQTIGNYMHDELVSEPELLNFLEHYSPHTTPRDFVRRERLIARDGDMSPVYASAVLFSELPAAVLPKKCSVKITRYTTTDASPTRDHLGSQRTVEGPLNRLIAAAVDEIKNMVESVSVLTSDGMTKAKYPKEAIKEVLVNAVIHRDYNISDDTHVFIFDNRIEIKSPGRLPGHITVETMMKERFARNPKVVRLLNRYPDPPNKDIGEGLRTAFQRMEEVRLKPPEIHVDDSSVTVTLPHETLAAPEDAVIEYMKTKNRINNRTAREITGIKSENQMKDVFYRLRDEGLITLVPAGGSSYWRHSTEDEARDQIEKAKTRRGKMTK
ncbi:ATP-binding protein [Haliangium ochraceum]|uniref:Putative transcriptional regulator n=1 Tax=Haliangium ochraceum (strain DSM 14365 / JCM 11303 / SMP-2) TaxID=502025 RepID=D0LMZ9_HALO1|nr:ATP-binding protein [Haliangium ochraceum]ACY13370.1 putative transcriptional regulator [Haliangium ochraceum DSM 14365]